MNSTLTAKGEKIVKSSCTGCHGIDFSGNFDPNLHNLSLSKD
ncbi:c-type cytochrome [Ureibacillus thermosphaericus]|nr:cytochrome c [Ureibacillus thermosphaericus]